MKGTVENPLIIKNIDFKNIGERIVGSMEVIGRLVNDGIYPGSLFDVGTIKNINLLGRTLISHTRPEYTTGRHFAVTRERIYAVQLALEDASNLIPVFGSRNAEKIDAILENTGGSLPRNMKTTEGFAQGLDNLVLELIPIRDTIAMKNGNDKPVCIIVKTASL